MPGIEGDGIADHVVRRPASRRELLAAGASRADLDVGLWRRVWRDVYVWSLLPAQDPDVRVAAAARLLPPDGALGGWAAARVLGAALDGRTPWGAIRPVLLCVPEQRKPSPQAGVEILRAPLPGGDVTSVGGLRVTSAARTCFDLARRDALEEAVAGVDAMLHAGQLTLVDARHAADTRPGWRAVPRARQVLALANGGAENPMESRFRLLWRAAGRPAVRANIPIYTRTGEFLGRVDLLDAEAGCLASTTARCTPPATSAPATTGDSAGSSAPGCSPCGPPRSTYSATPVPCWPTSGPRRHAAWPGTGHETAGSQPRREKPSQR